MPAKRLKRPPPRRAYHHGHLREALIDAGMAHLEHGDAESLSLRDLARQAGVTANAVYRHFDGKEALQAALAAEGFRRLLAAQVAAAQAQRSPRDTLLDSGRAYLRFAHSQPSLYRLMFGRYGATHRQGELGEAASASFGELARQVAAAFGLSDTDERMGPSTVYVWALVHGLSELWIDGQFDGLTPDTAALVETVVALAAAIAPPMVDAEVAGPPKKKAAVRRGR
ncbi:MAG: TetR/AcrR family transcriptional regulator [Panacagrimonas sp.]